MTRHYTTLNINVINDSKEIDDELTELYKITVWFVTENAPLLSPSHVMLPINGKVIPLSGLYLFLILKDIQTEHTDKSIGCRININLLSRNKYCSFSAQIWGI